MVAEYSVS